MSDRAGASALGRAPTWGSLSFEVGTFSIGQVLGDRYRIEAPLARGGMGAVYRATDVRIGRPVALKVLLPDFAADVLEVARFQREATAIASLHHPGIVQVLDLGRDGAAPYLVMELVAGQTLSAVLSKEGKLEAWRAADVIEQALFAISAAHSAGIVHRDLKPGNVMVVPTGGREAVKVLDFGIAQLKTGVAYTRLTQTGVILGTPAFMAPEQARGEPCDARTDVYAMGVVLWCLLTGKKAFAGRDMADVIAQVLDEVPTRADRVDPSVPPALAAVCDRALQKRPSDRFASAADFASALAGERTRTSIPVWAPAPATAAPFATSTRVEAPRSQATAVTRPLPPGERAFAPSDVPSTAASPYVPSTAASRAPVAETAAPPPTYAQSLAPPTAYAPSLAPPSAYASSLAPPVQRPGPSTRTLVLGGIALVAATALLTCVGSAYAFHLWTTSMSAPRIGNGYGFPPPGPRDSPCERAIRCCELLAGSSSGCIQLRTYETMGSDGESACEQMLTLYLQSAAAQGLVCD
jgi:serine/threonine protein kinase